LSGIDEHTGGVRDRSFVALAAACFSARLAFWLAFLGMLSLASFRLHGTPAEISVIGALFGAPTILLAPLAGAWVDRRSKSRSLAAAYLAVAVLLAAAASADAVWQLLIVSAAWGTAGTIVMPALGGLIKGTIPDESLRRANGIIQAGWEVALLIGPVTGGALAARFGVRTPFYAAAGLDLVAALLLVLAVRDAPIPPQGESRRFLSEVREGLAVVRGRPELSALVLWGGLGIGAVGALVSIEPIFVREALGGGAARLGLLYSLTGTGSVTAALVVGRLRSVGSELAAAGAALAACGAGILAYIGTARWPAVAPMQPVIGAGFASYLTLAQTLTQRRAPEEAVGRVVAARRGVEESAGLLATLGAGSAASLLGVRSTLLGLGAVVAVSGVALRLRGRALAGRVEQPAFARAE
jgi:predicted MFS family arabinose efflux permease